MATASSPRQSPAQTECYVFVDHSNLWIAGQIASAKGLMDTDVDSRYRVDLGRFLKLLARDRHISKAFLFGSVPPQNDSLWNAAREKNFDVKTYKRSVNGHEKELDVAMAVEITETIGDLPHKEGVIFIIVTGDRDLKPPIERAIKRKVHVELWSWEHSMSSDFRKLANASELFTVKKLDEVKKSFSYTAIMSKRKKNAIDPTHAIAYRDIPRGKPIVYALAEHVAQLKLQFYVTCNDFEKEGKQDLIFEFPNTKPDTVLGKLSGLKGIEYHPCSYPEYKTHLHLESQPIQTSNKYTILGMENSSPEVTESLSENEHELSLEKGELLVPESTEKNGPSRESPENGAEVPDSSKEWIVVRRKHKKKKHSPQQKCPHGTHCEKASACRNKHTEYEKKLFDKYPKLPFPCFRTRMCPDRDKHLKEEDKMKWCRFAHDERDSWCLKCKMNGHFTDQCKG